MRGASRKLYTDGDGDDGSFLGPGCFPTLLTQLGARRWIFLRQKGSFSGGLEEAGRLRMLTLFQGVLYCHFVRRGGGALAQTLSSVGSAPEAALRHETTYQSTASVSRPHTATNYVPYCVLYNCHLQLHSFASPTACFQSSSKLMPPSSNMSRIFLAVASCCSGPKPPGWVASNCTSSTQR